MQLINIFSNILYFTTVNKEFGFGQFDFSKLQQRYHDMISEAERQIKQCGFQDSQWRSALFAIAVWIDESILLSGWQHRDQWQKQSLQRTFFHTANGGSEFYTRLESLGNSETEIMELYDVIMSLGFKGSLFRESDMIKKKKIMENTMNILASSLDMSIPGRIFSSAYGRNNSFETETGLNRALITRTVLLSAPPVLFALVYFILYSGLSGLAKSWIRLF